MGMRWGIPEIRILVPDSNGRSKSDDQMLSASMNVNPSARVVPPPILADLAHALGSGLN